MDQSYFSYGSKGPVKRDHLLKPSPMSLQELVQLSKESPALISHELILKSLCEEMKGCLEHEDLKSCLQAFFRIEFFLQELQEIQDEISELPSLKEFYEVLSPTLLRVLWEGLEGNLKLEELKDRWLEALRVSLEEELYLWQEKMVN